MWFISGRSPEATYGFILYSTSESYITSKEDVFGLGPSCIMPELLHVALSMEALINSE